MERLHDMSTSSRPLGPTGRPLPRLAEPRRLEDLDTPALVVDTDRLDRNIGQMANVCLTHFSGGANVGRRAAKHGSTGQAAGP